LTSELARYQELRVIAYESTRRWKGKKIDPRAAGRDLGVRFLIEGSIRKDAKTVKVNLHVVDTQNGQRVWGEQYCRELKADSLIALQEEMPGRWRPSSTCMASSTNPVPGVRRRPISDRAFLQFYHHVTIMSPQTFAETLKVLKHAVARDPDSGLAWSLLAFLYGQSYALQFSPIDSPLEQALVAAQKGALLEPQNQLVRAALAQMYFFRNERRLFLLEAETALALNPNAPAIIGFLGWLLALYGEWERGLAILKKGRELNPHYPGWFHLAPFFYYYLHERFEEAYQEARAFQMPQLFWDPLLRAAALGWLGREKEGAGALAELLLLRPDFHAAGPFLISCYAKFPDLIEGLLDGLRQASLKT
jgi:adenylate cyclase